MRSLARWLCLSALPLTLWHCAEEGPDPGPLPPAVQMELDEAQIARLEELSRTIAEGLEIGYTKSFEDALDIDRLIGRSLHGVETPPDFKEMFVERLRGNPAMITGAFRGGNYEFLRVLDRDGAPMLLFRVQTGQAGFNYIAFLFDFDDTGNIEIYDFYNFLTGQSLSESMRQLAVLALAQSNYSFVGRLVGRDRAWADNMHNFDMVRQLLRAQEYGEVIRFLDKLPREMQEQKSLRLIEIQTLGKIDGVGERYDKAVESYREAFPDDPSLPLVTFDYHVIRGEYDRAIRNIDELDRTVGGDPFLDDLRILVTSQAEALQSENGQDVLTESEAPGE